MDNRTNVVVENDYVVIDGFVYSREMMEILNRESKED